MTKINKHIEIVRSSIVSLSSMSQVSCDAIYAILAKHYSRVGVTTVNNLTDLEGVADLNPDLVFLGMDFVPVNQALGSEDPDKIWLADYLDEHDIAYTGSGQLAHELDYNKPLAKQRALDAGLQTSPFYVIRQNQSQKRHDKSLVFPLFIKPTNRGGGQGIDSNSVAYNIGDVDLKVKSIAVELQSDSLIEQYLPGREFSVAILKNEFTSIYSVMPIELIAPADKNGVRILSAEIKSADTESFVEITDKKIKAKISILAMKVFRALGARDYGRIDIRLDKFGIPQFLEANLIPSLISGFGNFPKACLLNLDMSHENLILNITSLGLVRSKNQPELIPA